MAEFDELNTTTEGPDEPAKTGKKRRWGKKQPETPDTGASFSPSEPKKGLAEKLRIIRERRLLRKDLIAKGIRSKEDFELIAESMGLVLWKDNGLLLWWHFASKNLASGVGLGSLLAGAAGLLAAMFMVSSITEVKGSFTINLTADMLRSGFTLYDEALFDSPQTRLISEKLEEVNNITLTDIPKDIDYIDGPHNGRDYVAYTFYIRNEGEIESTYAWYLNMLSESLDVGKAVWIMLFEDGNQVIYAEATDEGKPEELFGFLSPPFGDVAYDSNQYYQEDRRYGLITTPYVSESVVAQGIIENVPPGEAHKYTVVIWIEGYDPDCTDELFGGHAKYAMEFQHVSAEDDDSIFSGLFRTEYKDYGMNPEAK